MHAMRMQFNHIFGTRIYKQSCAKSTREHILYIQQILNEFPRISIEIEILSLLI